MARRWSKLAILHKVETTYGTDAVPAAANAIVATSVTFTPIEAEEISRDLMLPYMGNQGVVLDGMYAKLEFDVEIAGAGAAGTAPKYGSLLRIAGLAETVTAGTSVKYQIVEDALESGSLCFVSDRVQHVLLGCRANVAASFAPGAIPHFRFSVWGLLGTVTDIGAMPASTMAGWTTPVPASKANSTLSLHGWAAIAESLDLDPGNTVTPRFLIGDESIQISGRSGSGKAVVEATPLVTITWFDRARQRTRGALSMIHGKAAGNIVEITAPAVEIGKPTQGETNGIINHTLPLSLCPVAGRDEIDITVR